MINHLEPHQIIIVGTNAMGAHGGGAAAQAYKDFGALWGQSEGCIGGQCYGIVTLDAVLKKVSLGYIGLQANRLKEVAKENPDKEFLLTPVGTGIAGFTMDEIDPLFENLPDNIVKVGWDV